MLTNSVAILMGSVAAQSANSVTTPAYYPEINFSQCDASGCTTKKHKITLDANWRWFHTNDGFTNCFDGTAFDTQFCPSSLNGFTAPYTSSEDQCVSKCGVDNISQEQWANTYGITSPDDDSLTLKFVEGSNVGSRVYLMDESGDNYFGWNLLNREFSMDVDVADLVCGLNGAVYFVDMHLNGNAKYGTNSQGGEYAGAKYGTGYCDAQCPHDIKYIHGEGNNLEWDSSKSNGLYGACCAEFDIWEANKISQAFTNHVCIDTPNYPEEKITKCNDADFTAAPDHPTFGFCGDNEGVRDQPNFGGDARMNSMCDKNGCDFQPYRLGDTTFYGPGPEFQVDSTKKVTVVTQFITNDGTDNGDLSEVRRYFIQDGKQVMNPQIEIAGTKYDSLTDEFCTASANWYGEASAQNEIGAMYAKKSGMAQMGKQLKEMVLALSLWADDASQMKWLDSAFPPLNGQQPTNGQVRGSCPGDNQSKDDLVRDHPNATTTFSNLKFGTIGSTNDVSPGSTTAAPQTTSPPQPTQPGCKANLETGCTADSECCSGKCETAKNADGSDSSVRFCSSCDNPATTTAAPVTTKAAPVTTTAAPATTTAAPADCANRWGQCGGQNWTGPTCCKDGFVCKVAHQWYSQCLSARQLESDEGFFI